MIIVGPCQWVGFQRSTQIRRLNSVGLVRGKAILLTTTKSRDLRAIHSAPIHDFAAVARRNSCQPELLFCPHVWMHKCEPQGAIISTIIAWMVQWTLSLMTT